MRYHKPPFKLEELKIEVTYRCPLTCLHCSSDANPSNNIEMTFEKCLKILHEAVDIGVKEIAFSGGEPLIWPYIENVVEFVASKNIKVNLYTSGNGKNNIRKILNILKRNGLHTIIFSLYGSDPQSHEEITRIRGSFNKTIAAIEFSNHIGLETEIHFVPLAKNFKLLNNIATLGKKMGVARISILRFVPQGRGSLLKNDVLNRIQNIQLKKDIENLRLQGYEIRTGSPFNFLLLNKQPQCCSGINRLFVSPDFRIYPCDAFKQVKAEEIVGTIEFSSLENSSLKECWDKSFYLKAIRNYLTTDFSEPCTSCENIEKCLSGCLAQKFIAYGDIKKRPDPMCLLN